MVMCNLADLVASIDNVEYEDELKIVIQAVKKKEQELKEASAKKENRIKAISTLFSECQQTAEEKLETLFDDFSPGADSMYIKITAKNMAECLARLGYKVERPHEDEDENPLINNFYFTLNELKFYDMYRDNVNDVIIPLEL